MKNFMLGYINHFRQLYPMMFQQAAQKYKLTQLEMDILLFLNNNPNYNTARDISAMRGFAKSNVSNAVDSLKKKGYLITRTDEDCRKIQRLFLCGEKQEVFEELTKCQHRCFAALIKNFSEQEISQFLEFMKRLDANIVEELNQDN